MFFPYIELQKISGRNSFLWIIPFCLALIFLSCGREQTQQKGTAEDMKEAYPIVVAVNGMYCELCSKNIERSFKELEEVEAVNASVSKKWVGIKLKNNKSLTKTHIKNIIADAGYEVEGFLEYPAEPEKEVENEYP